MATKQSNPEKSIATTAIWIYVNKLTNKMKQTEKDSYKKQKS